LKSSYDSFIFAFKKEMSNLSKETQMVSLVELWKQSNKTKKQFAQEYGMTYDSFRYWTLKLCPEESMKRTSYKEHDFSFIELNQEEFKAGSSRTPQIELMLPNGIQLKIY
jgi:hypothetical protein